MLAGTWLLAGVAAVVGLTGAGLLLQRRERAEALDNGWSGLSRIASLKTMQVHQWAHDRTRLVEIVAHALQRELRLAEPLAVATDDVRRALEGLCAHQVGTPSFRRVALLSPDGARVLLTLPADQPFGEAADADAVRRAGAERRTVVGEPVRTPGGEVWMDVVTRVHAEDDPEERPLALLVVRADARFDLLPAVLEWPEASDTSEIVFARRREGALWPLTAPRSASSARAGLLPGAPASVRRLHDGQEASEREDYRGQDVLAVTQDVPGTHWTLVVKTDREEVLRPTVASLGGLTLQLAAVLGLLAVVGGFAFRRHRASWRATRDEDRARLRAVEVRFDAFAAGSNEAMLLVDGEDRIVEVNDRAERMYGYGAGELAGRPLSAILPPGETLRAAAVREELGRRGEASFEAVNRRRDGVEFPVDVSVRRLARGGGALFLGIIRDITARKEAERRQAESEEFLRRTLDAIPERIGILDATGRLVCANESWRRNGGDAGHCWGRCVVGSDLVSAHRAAACRDCAHAAGLEEQLRRVQDGSETGFETEYACACSSPPAYLRLRVNRFGEASRPLRIVTIEDVTERRRTEEALRAKEAEFLQAQKMEAVGRLAGGVAHDFNNLLTVISGWAGILLARPGDAASRRPIGEVAAAADRAAALVRQLLAFSRKQVAQPRVVDPNAIVRGLEPMLRRLVSEDVRIETRLDPTVGGILADAGQVEQALMNLVVNARDAMPHGGRIEIATSERNACAAPDAGLDGRCVTLRVSDTGTGISDEVRAHLFEPFFTTKEPGKGTGLGLATVYGIVAQAGGRIEVESRVGAGSAFVLSFPRVALPAARGDARDAYGEVGRGSGQVVLLVDDDEGVRGFAASVLAERGFVVHSAEGPTAALRILRGLGGAVDLVVTDIVMPEMSGRALVRQARGLFPRLRALLVSGYSGDSHPDAVLDPGEVLLQKPFTGDDLVVAVTGALDRSSPAGGAASPAA
jgi:PAS domain S-box-containing protein